MNSKMTISVIVPVLNEGRFLENTLKRIGSGVEIIIVDGGSSDATLETAGRFAAKIISSERGRGCQMDAGASGASGDVLVFLHADTKLPLDWEKNIEDAISDNSVVGGGFRLRIDSQGTAYRLIEFAADMRSRFPGLIYGDQAIFVRKSTFVQTGGFMGLPLMEDVDFIRRLAKFGRVVLLAQSAVTSARRWERNGILKTTLRNWTFLFFYYIGIAPDKLYRWYYGASYA